MRLQVQNAGINGGDFGCGQGQSDCTFYGSESAAALACYQSPVCNAFTYEPNEGKGKLKYLHGDISNYIYQEGGVDAYFYEGN